MDRGRIELPFKTAMEGGTLSGRLASNLRVEGRGSKVEGSELPSSFDPRPSTLPLADTPMLSIRYDAYKLLPTPAVKPLVEAFFPGMAVTGYVT